MIHIISRIIFCLRNGKKILNGENTLKIAGNYLEVKIYYICFIIFEKKKEL